jgi:hypothetical protein
LLRYTQLGDLNDPFEAKPHISGITSKPEADATFEKLLPEETARSYEELSPEIRALLPKETWALLVRARYEHIRSDLHPLMESLEPLVRRLITRELDRLVGVLSLSEVPDNLLMWAHYTASHAGFVLGFDPQDPYFDRRRAPTDEFRHLRRVAYRDNRPQALMVDLEGTDLFLTKSIHWSYEREWRVLEPLVGAKKVIARKPFPIYLCEYPVTALREITLGARMQDGMKSTITGYLHEPEFRHVLLRQATLDDRDFAVRLTEVAV